MDLVSRPGNAPQIAAWDHPLGDPNLEDAPIAHAFAPFSRVPVLGRVEAAYRQRFRLKSWQYMTAVSDELFIAFVVGTAGFASNGFVYAVELATGRVHKRFAIMPMMVGTRLAPSSTAGVHRFATQKLSIAIENAGRAFSARIDARTESGGRLAADLAFTSDDSDEHLAVCVPLPGGRWNYTHKLAGFSVRGHVTTDDRRYELQRGFGTLDFTKMYALRHAVWRWIALCGRSTTGAIVGINLVDPTPEAPISENAVWIGGKHYPLANVQISPEAGFARAEGLDLTMREVTRVEQRLDVPLVRHRLRHVVGAFSGSVTTAGTTHELQSIVGIAEDNDTWW